jgi:hypothetical protein
MSSLAKFQSFLSAFTPQVLPLQRNLRGAELPIYPWSLSSYDRCVGSSRPIFIPSSWECDLGLTSGAITQLVSAKQFLFWQGVCTPRHGYWEPLRRSTIK